MADTPRPSSPSSMADMPIPSSPSSMADTPIPSSPSSMADTPIPSSPIIMPNTPTPEVLARAKAQQTLARARQDLIDKERKIKAQAAAAREAKHPGVVHVPRERRKATRVSLSDGSVVGLHAALQRVHFTGAAGDLTTRNPLHMPLEHKSAKRPRNPYEKLVETLKAWWAHDPSLKWLPWVERVTRERLGLPPKEIYWGDRPRRRKRTENWTPPGPSPLRHEYKPHCKFIEVMKRLIVRGKAFLPEEISWVRFIEEVAPSPAELAWIAGAVQKLLKGKSPEPETTANSAEPEAGIEKHYGVARLINLIRRGRKLLHRATKEAPPSKEDVQDSGPEDDSSELHVVPHTGL